MGLLDQVIGGVVGQVLGGGRGGALASPVVKALLMLLLAKGGGGLGDILGRGSPESGGRSFPGPGEDDGDLGGLDREPDDGSGAASHGLDGLIQSFERSGLGDVIGSWIGHGPNREIAPNRLHRDVQFAHQLVGGHDRRSFQRSGDDGMPLSGQHLCPVLWKAAGACG